ncbi:MAG: hypothetical protein D6725_14985 [Planctomycetota bacterium]|nr:MAG: hypothetical protein D6725_14985 [Planctomycetota bacterium]
MFLFDFAIGGLAMTAKSAFPPEQLENIAAYLDGELPEEQAAEIERTLATSPEARQELQEMVAAWEMLDVLPRIRATEAFTKQTLASIRVEAAAGGRPKRRWVEHAIPVAMWGVLLGVVAAVSFAVAAHWGRQEYEPVLEKLALLENEPLYREVGSLKFLQKLHESGLFAEDVSPQDGAAFDLTWFPQQRSPDIRGGASDADATWIVAQYDRAEAIKRVERMPQAERERILAAFQRLQQMSSDQLAALEQLHRAVAADPDLQVTLRRYVQWLRSLDVLERDRIRSAGSDDERLALVRDARQSERLLALRLQPEELERIISLVEQRLPIPEEVRRRFNGGQSQAARQLRFLEMIARAIDLRGTPGAETWEELEKHLMSERARSVLAAEPNIERRWWGLLHAALMTVVEQLVRKHPPPVADTEKLDELLDQLPDDERNRILRLSPEDARRELWRRYVMRELQQRPKADREAWPAIWQAHRLAQEIRAVITGERTSLRWIGGGRFDPRKRGGERPPFPRGRGFPNGPRGGGPGADRPGNVPGPEGRRLPFRREPVGPPKDMT